MTIDNGDRGHFCWPTARKWAVVFLMAGTAFASPPSLAAGGGDDTGSGTSRQRIFTYFLPRTEISVEVAQRLAACPDGKDPPEVVTAITVTPKKVADPGARIQLDASGSVFAKRTVKIELNPDGTLASFNSEAEGQGGPILTSLAKLAFQVAAMGGRQLMANSDGSSQGLKCNAATTAIMARITSVSDQIRALEALIIEGKGNDAATSLLADLRTRRSQLRDALILKRTTKAPIVPADGTTLTAYIEAPDYNAWFTEPDVKGAKLAPIAANRLPFPGGHGFQVTIDPDDAMLAQLQTGDLSVLPDKPTPNVVYRRPVPASIAVAPCSKARVLNDQTGVYNPCAEADDSAASEASLSGQVMLPQLSGYYSIRTGRGGLFGSRQATAKFDANGAPTALEYGSVSASADLAGLVDTTGEGIKGLRDAELAKLQRQIEIEEARKKLDELRSSAADGED